MGISGLWDVLKENGCMRRFEAFKGQNVFSNLKIAIDASIWIFEAFHQPALAKMSVRERVAKVTFERVCEILKLGALPVLVFDEKPPEAKGKSGSYGTGWAFLPQLIDLLSSIGVPTIRTGKRVGIDAECLCAYLNRENIVDVVISNDSDSLLYGARVVYKDCTFFPKPSAEIFSQEVIEEKTGLDRFGLISFSLLTGSDFSDGVKQIGSRRALRIVSSIASSTDITATTTFSSHRQLNNVMVTFLSPLSDEERRLCAINKCEKHCLRCGHRCSKQNHGPRGCKECGTHSKTRGGNGKGFCLETLESGSTVTCPCEFHVKALERERARVKRSARSKRPNLENEFKTVIRTFLVRIPKVVRDKAQALNFQWWTRFEYDESKVGCFDILKNVLRRKSSENSFSETLQRRLIPLKLEICVRYV